MECYRYVLGWLFIFQTVFLYAQNGDTTTTYLLSRERLNKRTTVITGGKKTRGEIPGVALKKQFTNNIPDSKSDVEILLKVPHTGMYVIEVHTSPINFESLKAKDTTGLMTVKAAFKLGQNRITKRIVYDVYKKGTQVIGKFNFSNTKESLQIWLSPDLIFHSLTIKPYVPPSIPEEVLHYLPDITPPEDRPRLWVNKESLPIVKSRLNTAENKDAWDKVKLVALKPYSFKFDSEHEMFYDEDVERTIEYKAFYYLMTNDEKIGRDAVHLISNYYSVLEFGNVSYGDISREIGRALYTGALVYDWCYSLMDESLRAGLRKHFKRLARDMEIGWPPFFGMESIVNGHGNEAQICRDMLSWSIAVYNEDPEPYKYVSYTILKQLVPMRKFEYQSPRHNQGVDYGAYRFGWEMHAVWIYYRMLGYSVFDDNIKDLSDYWLYMRTPDGKMLRDGDMFNVKYNTGEDFYWKSPQTMLLCYAFSGNALIKGEFYKQGGLPDNPVLFLLINDPELKPDYNLNQLPLTKDFGPVLGSMIARTGWGEDKTSSDVVAEIKGGGFHFGNHQHADAGALQIYHHGIQVGDLGLYLSYGSPYDFNFNKRSVAHSMVLVRDPNEPLLFRTKSNDGGTRFSQRFPRTVREVLTDSWFRTGYVRSSDFGPDSKKPVFSYFNTDLTAAYTSKVEAYSRSFLFLNTGKKDVPAIILLWDHVKSAKKSFAKFWQINTLYNPEVADSGKIRLYGIAGGKSGNTEVNMLKPAWNERKMEIKGGDSVGYVFGDLYSVKSPWPEARGYRIMISPADEMKQTEFITVFQMVEEGQKPYPLDFEEMEGFIKLVVDNKVIIMAKPENLLREKIVFSLPDEKLYEVIITGVKEGFWNISGSRRKGFNYWVQKDKNTIYFTGKDEEIVLNPGRDYESDEGSYD